MLCDSLMSTLYSQLVYFTVEFQDLQLIVLVMIDVSD